MSDKGLVLVTGASGFLGRRTVEMLLDRGYKVRALARDKRSIDFSGVEVYECDLSDAQALHSAMDGIDYVIHAAADTSGSDDGARRVTIQGTNNILEQCKVHQIRKLVYISSCSVYGVKDLPAGTMIKETSPLEPFAEKRGAYSWGKFEAEKAVMLSMVNQEIPAVCLRPGTIYGCGGENYTPLLGLSKGHGLYIVFGNGEMILPLVYLDNLVGAILLAMENAKSLGQVYTVVDPERVSKKRYMNTLIRKLHPDARFLFVPLQLLAVAVRFQELIFGLIGRKPIITHYRLMSSQNPVVYDPSKIINELGWQPLVSFDDAVEKIVECPKC